MVHPLCRVDTSLGAPSARRWQEAQEEELHDAQEDQAQAQEGQVGRPQILPRGRQRQDPPPSQVSNLTPICFSHILYTGDRLVHVHLVHVFCW